MSVPPSTNVHSLTPPAYWKVSPVSSLRLTTRMYEDYVTEDDQSNTANLIFTNIHKINTHVSLPKIYHGRPLRILRWQLSTVFPVLKTGYHDRLAEHREGNWSKIQDRECKYNVRLRGVRVPIVAVEKQECVSALLSYLSGMQMAFSPCRAVLPPMACLVLPRFHIISQTTTFSEKQIIEQKTCFGFLYNACLKHFSF